MEPRLLRHGNVEVIVQGLPAPQELQWSHVFSDMEIPSGCGGTIVEGEDGLQWSHVFSDMEISMGYLEAIFTELIDASMEPRLLRHGNLGVPAVIVEAIKEGFNGATSSQTWK